jgi:lipopolysaccharide transport system permease protein
MAAEQLTKPREEVIFLRPTHGLAALNLRDLWVYRELVLFLAWRDVLVRYKQTVLGAAWAVIQPVIQMVVLTDLFKSAGFARGCPIPSLMHFCLGCSQSHE